MNSAACDVSQGGGAGGDEQEHARTDRAWRHMTFNLTLCVHSIYQDMDSDIITLASQPSEHGAVIVNIAFRKTHLDFHRQTDRLSRGLEPGPMVGHDG